MLDMSLQAAPIRPFPSNRASTSVLLRVAVQGIADLLAFDQADAQRERVEQLNRHLIRLQAGRAFISGLREMLDILLTDGCVWAMLVVAIPLVRSGQLNGIYLAFIVLAAFSSFEAVRPLANAAQQLSGCREAARRLFDVVDREPAIRDSENTVSMPTTYDLALHNLSFRYSEQTPVVLNEITFSVPQGRCLAIVGPSGAGKSTIANLLARPDASEKEMEQAAQQALLHDFIQALPQGYDTLIGEQGFKFSGGERQRLAIARAILKDAPILLLDEPTAHLDASTEEGILHALRTFMQGRTTIMITHRLVGLDMADEILVMQDGGIKERGTQHELIQAEGLTGSSGRYRIRC